MLNNIDTNRIISQYNSGRGAPEIAKSFNVGNSTIYYHLNKNGIAIRPSSYYKQIYKINTLYFNKIDTEQKAYWLGFCYADLAVGIKKFRLKLAIKDANHVKKFRSMIGSNHPITNVRDNNGHLASQVQIASKQFIQCLVKQGCMQNKGQIIRWPSTKISRKLMRHFLRGYFDGDGCISIVSRSSTSYFAKFQLISNKIFCEQAQMFLMKHCKLNATKLRHDTRKNQLVYYVTYTGIYQLLRIYNLLYSGATVFLHRKKLIWEILLRNFSNKQLNS